MPKTLKTKLYKTLSRKTHLLINALNTLKKKRTLICKNEFQIIQKTLTYYFSMINIVFDEMFVYERDY